MFRAPLRRLRPASLPATRVHVLTARRATSTSTNTTAAGGKRKGTWKAGAARWGVAAGALYWYWTSPLFADDPAPVTKAAPVEDEDVTVDRIVEEKRREMEARARTRQAKEAEEAAALQAEAEQKQQEDDAPGAATTTEPTNPEDAETVAAAAAVAERGSDAAPAAASSPAGDDDGENPDMSQEAAYNPETGEINWDCPCLGGMAHGPCGEQFREAFSCFVHSTEEPKGMDCIDKFQGMQDCFRLHPDVYGAELAEEAEAEAEVEAAAATEGDARAEAPRGEDTEAAPPQDDGPAATPEDDGSAAAAPEAVSEEAASDAIKAETAVEAEAEAKPDAKTES